MIATLRHDVGAEFFAALADEQPELAFATKAHTAARWAGVYKERWQCHTFSVRLPRDVTLAVRLMRYALRVARAEADGYGAVAVKGARVLGGKLRLSLGLPFGGDYAPGEELMTRQLLTVELSGELDRWLVYTDWLKEAGTPNALRRASVIEAWLAPKATAVKYGVILLALERGRRSEYSYLRPAVPDF